jgi:hypothetical protein
MKTLAPLSFLLLLLLLLQSCEEERSEMSSIRSSGATAEVIVVMEDGLWQGRPGEILRTSLTQEMPGMPWGEARFRPVQIGPKNFDKNYQRHHNIIIAQLNERLDSSSVETMLDRWAKPQRLIHLRAGTAEELIQAWKKREENIIELLRESGRARMQRLFAEMQDVNLKKRMMETMGLNLTLPGGFSVARMTPEFAWLRKETKDFSQGIIIYFTPYEDTTYFNTQLLINRRNQMCMLYIPGEKEGSYMTTANSFPPESFRIYFKDRFAVETRGLWDVVGDFMGGPFLNYAILDEENNRIISLDGYVYYPNNDKRDLLLQLEAMFYTLEF